MPLKIIFFDLGGVLVKVEALPALARLSELLGWPLEKTLDQWNAFQPITLNYEAGQLTTKDYLDNFKNYFRAPIDQTIELFTRIFKLDHEAIQIAERLRKSFQLGIISNTNPLHFYRIMCDFHELHAFNEPITSYYVKSLKPDLKIFEAACRRFSVSPQECVFIDDRLENVEAAARLGMRGIQYHSANQLAGDLRHLGILS